MTEKVKRGRGRPRKIQNVEEINVEKTMTEELLPVKLVYRAISKSGFDDEYGFSTATIENYIASFYDQGYKLFSTHYAGEDPNALHMMYILVLNA